MSSQGRWDWGAGAGAGQRSDRTAAPRWLNKLAVRQDLRGGYGYGYRHGYRYRDGIAACARAGRRVAKKKSRSAVSYRRATLVTWRKRQGHVPGPTGLGQRV